mgnify:CR=1 FL=1
MPWLCIDEHMQLQRRDLPRALQSCRHFGMLASSLQADLRHWMPVAATTTAARTAAVANAFAASTRTSIPIAIPRVAAIITATITAALALTSAATAAYTASSAPAQRGTVAAPCGDMCELDRRVWLLCRTR